MTFMRGGFGLANYALFYGVDAVVWLEGGGEALTLAQVASGRCYTESEDMRYWQTVFSRFMPEKTLRFRAVGAKPTLKDLAVELSKTNCRTAFVAMDRDADGLRGDTIEDKGRVMYTWGYSWENDLTSPALIAKAALLMCPLDYQEHRTQVETAVELVLETFLGRARRFIVADAILNVVAREGLFDRQNYKRYVTGRGDVTAVPGFDPHDLKLRLSQKNRKHAALRPRQVQNGPVDPLRDCFGHLLACFTHCLFKHQAKALGQHPEHLSLDLVSGLLTVALSQLWDEPAMMMLRVHHETQFQ